ncbi:Protein-L-isoaspartate(D-aspartate) O-methyltransferase [Dirofilaria immitis]
MIIDSFENRTQRYCDYKLPPSFLSSSNTLEIYFKSDSTMASEGYDAYYYTVRPSEMGNVRDGRVEKVMLSVDRADFCPRNSYQDCPQQIGYNATISAPHMLVDQLAPGGRMVIPVGEVFSDQNLVQIDKDLNGNIKIEELFGVLFVPLTDKKYQLGRLKFR